MTTPATPSTTTAPANAPHFQQLDAWVDAHFAEQVAFLQQLVQEWLQALAQLPLEQVQPQELTHHLQP